MTETEKKDLVLAHLSKYPLGVMATSHADGTPEAAVVGISQRENLELIFDTLPHARKYQNLKARPYVAVVVGWDDNITVQYEGAAQELAGDEREECQRIHLEKIPSELEFLRKGAAVFKVTPRWIRYSDFSKDVPNVFELSF